MKHELAWLLLTAFLPCAAFADRLDERIPASPGGTLEIDLDLGDGLRPDPGSIEIGVHDGEDIRLLATPTGWGASGVAFRLDQDGDTVRLYGSVDGAFSWMFGGPNVTLRVWVPRQFSVDVSSSAGPIRIEEVEGDVRARTSDAAIEVSSIRGDVRVRSVDGDITLSEIVGDIRARTAEGDLDLSWIEGRTVVLTDGGGIRANHVDGSLEFRSERGGIELREVSGPIEARTERGSVFASFTREPEGLIETRRGSLEIEIPPDAGAQLDAEAREGSVEIGPGIRFEGEATPRTTAGAIRGGGPALRLYTARGRIRIRRR